MQFPEPPNKIQQGNRTTAAIHNPAMTPPGSGFDIGDIYFILFRHKWKILFCAILGVTSAATVYKLRPPPYESEAKLFIRYVMDSRTTGPSRDETRVKALDTQGDSVVSSELEIITSIDLAGEVVDAIGPDRILPKVSSPNLRNLAITALARNLEAEAAPRGGVIHITYRNGDPTIIQPVLQEVINRYLKKHVEIHRALGLTGDFLTQETDRLRARLAQTQEELSKAQSKIGVASVEDAKKASADQILRIKQDISTAEREYSERSIILHELTGTIANAPAKENAEPAAVPPQLEDYKRVSERLLMLRRKEEEALLQYTAESTPVKEIRTQIEEAIAEKTKYEDVSPALKNWGGPAIATASAQGQVRQSTFDPNAELARLKALEASIKTLHMQLDEARAEADKITQVESTIQELRRKKDLEETNYRYYSASLEQGRIDEALGAGHVSNISEIQSPSPPVRSQSKLLKTAAMIAAVGIFGGLAWAFAIEKLFDRTVKRPIDVERVSRLPLFISIPLIQNRQIRRFIKASKGTPAALPAPKANGAPAASLALEKERSSRATPAQILYPFHETLRDRLIAYFESINLTHKPKLVAVTGLSNQAGVTTVASGLAQRLSETGEGNVLLVDMTGGQGSAQQFLKGQPVCVLDDLFTARDTALMQEKLYVVKEGSNSEKLSRNLPQRFTKLVPKLKASDFDYIIFDMPPISQISVTPRLASFMDMVLLVIESEKNDSDLVQKASSLLAQANTRVGVVLNKTKTYIPRALYQESLGDL